MKFRISRVEIFVQLPHELVLFLRINIKDQIGTAKVFRAFDGVNWEIADESNTETFESGAFCMNIYNADFRCLLAQTTHKPETVSK